MERGELAAWLRLTLTPTVGNLTARSLLAAFGLPEAIFRQSEDALQQVVSAAQAKALLSEPAGLEALTDATCQWLQAAPPDQSRCVLTLADARYPPGLLAIEDPPPMLYAMGQVPEAWPVGIAIVGSRNPTPQGLTNARQFSRSLAQAGLTVVSGLALGVDGAAHEGALDEAVAGQLATIAVVGTGLDRVYPKRHLELAHRICLRGAIVSEHPLGTPPVAANFPRRNRIISALSQGTLVVEAALQSGSLITARMAAEQGREVFAIPGSIHSTQSRGCHLLIKQGAKLVESAQDILEELPMPDGRKLTASRAAVKALAGAAEGGAAADPPEDELLIALGFDPVSLDALIARTGTSAAELQARLLELELDGDVARLPGGLFQRVAAV